MTTPWHKAVRDFWHERARTILVMLAIALGISAFAAVMSSYAILTRELDRGYLDTNPASAILRVDSIDDALVAEILKNRGEAEVLDPPHVRESVREAADRMLRSLTAAPARR